MTKLGPCRVFTPKQRRTIARAFGQGAEIVHLARFVTPTVDQLAVEDAIRWVINNWESKKGKPSK